MGTREEITAALGEIDTEIAATEERLETLRLERRGAEALVRRLRLPGSAEPVTRLRAAPSQSVTESPRTGNKAIVADILAAYPEGLHLAEIEAKTAEMGTPLDNEQVRGAVTYLKRINRAEQAQGRGRWRLIPIDAETTSEAPEAVSALPDLRSGGGDADETGLDDHRHDLEGRNGGHPTGTSIEER